jgi:hypothetical protein
MHGDLRWIAAERAGVRRPPPTRHSGANHA